MIIIWDVCQFLVGERISDLDKGDCHNVNSRYPSNSRRPRRDYEGAGLRSDGTLTHVGTLSRLEWSPARLQKSAAL